MGRKDPIFVFKKYFSRNDAEIVVSGLIHHNIIWDHLGDDDFLKNLFDVLPAEIENWNAARVCLAVNGILLFNTDKADVSKIKTMAIPAEGLANLDIHLEDVAPLTAGLLAEQTQSGSWAAYLKAKGLDHLTRREIQDKWGTIFTMAFYLVEDADGFLQEFSQSADSAMQDLLAFILSANPFILETRYGDIKKAALATELPDLLQLLKKLDQFENKAIGQRIADDYLANKPVDKISAVSSIVLDKSSGELMRCIDLYKNYALLANYSSNKELADAYSERALNCSAQLNQMLEALNNAIKSPQDINSFPNSNGSLPKGEGITARFLLAAQIKDDDPQTARKIGKQIVQEMGSTEGMDAIFASDDLRSVISPVQVVRLLMDLNLIPEAAQAADSLIDYQPLYADLIRLAAELNYTYGDYRKAGRYYERLDLLADLTREEKLRQAQALAYEKNWKAALAIWKGVNLVSLDDFQRKAILCYQAKDKNSFDETVQTSRDLYNSEGLFQVLQALFEMDNGRLEDARQLIEEFVDKRKRDRYSLIYLITYYQRTNQLLEAQNIIQKLSSLEANLPEIMIKRYELAVQAGDRDRCRQILKQASQEAHLDDLTTIEQLLSFCFAESALEAAATLVEKAHDQWLLSPQIAAFHAQLLNEQGNFHQAVALLETLMQRDDLNADWLEQYGLALLQDSKQDFPLGIPKQSVKIDAQAASKIIALSERFQQNLLLQVIRTELDTDNAPQRYKDILTKEENHLNPDIWRVHAGLGKYYFNHGQFDLAVVNFKEAAKAQPQKKALNVMLLKALGRIGLYDEAMNTFANLLAQDSLDIADMLEINASLKHSDQWLRNLEKYAGMQAKEPILQIGLAQLYAEKSKAKEALECVRQSGLTTSPDGTQRLICVQILLQAGMEKEAIWILESFLSEKKTLSDAEFLSGAFLYIAMGETRKAINLLNLIEHADPAVLALKSELFQQAGQSQEALAAINFAMEMADSNPSNLHIVKALAGIQAPLVWANFNGQPENLYVQFLQMRIANKDFTGAFVQAQQNLEIFPHSLRLQTIALSLAHILGEEQDELDLLANAPDWNNISEIDESMAMWGEAALKFEQEVLAANVLSSLLDVLPESRRVKALQARLLERNGNHADAAAIMVDLLANLGATEQSDQNQNALWLAEAAFELHRNPEGMHISRQILEQSGKTKTTLHLFLRGLAGAAFDNWLKTKLDVEFHQDAISEEDRAYFDDICAGSEAAKGMDKEAQALIAETRFWLDGQKTNAIVDSHPYVTLVDAYQNAGSQRAEILMDGMRSDPQAWMILAVMELDNNPAKSVEYATTLLRGGQADPLKYALLASAKEKIGQPADAYAAINLALNAWPQEYKWQLRAGELSKSLGDVKASLEHFKKAAEVHKDESTQVYLGEISLQAGSMQGIAYLEKKLNGSPQDFNTLVQLGELSIKNNKLQKAARYLDKARKINPQDARVHLLLSEVAAAVGNYAKAKEMVNEAGRIQPHDLDVLLQKAAITAKSEGSQAALDYMQHLQDPAIQQDTHYIIRKAQYINEVEGPEKALEFLLPKSFDADEPALLLETAKTYLDMDKLDLSEEFAERALQQNPMDARSLNMLARISGKSGDLDKAVDLLVKAIQNDPFDAAQYIDLARIYQSRRDISQATETLENGLRTNPINFELLNALGLLYYQQGQYNQAQDVLRQAVSVNPRDENVKRLLSTLTNANIIQGSMKNDTLVEEA